MIGRRRVLGGVFALTPSWAFPAAGGDVGASATGLVRPRSLVTELRKAVLARRALVILVSLEHCPYCQVVRDSYLLPLHAAGQPAVEIDMHNESVLLDMHGRRSTQRSVAKDFRVRVAPTVLFLGRDGSEAAERLEGLSSRDFYGAYLEQRLQAANQAVAA